MFVFLLFLFSFTVFLACTVSGGKSFFLLQRGCFFSFIMFFFFLGLFEGEAFTLFGAAASCMSSFLLRCLDDQN